MIGQPYIAPKPCTKCQHKQALEPEVENLDAFEACFVEHLRIKDTSDPTEQSKKMEVEGDFLQSLFSDMGMEMEMEPLGSQSPLGSASSGSSGSSDFSNGDNINNNTPATELSPTSPPQKFEELDLDGFTPGAPTFPVNHINKPVSDSAAPVDYLNCGAQTPFSEAITPGKTIFAPSLATQNPQFTQKVNKTSTTKPNLSIYPAYQQTQRTISQTGAASPMDAFSVIDPALTSLHGLPSATDSVYSTVFSQPASEPASAIEPSSVTSTKATKSRKSSAISEHSTSGETKTQPKRKRVRKTEATSPADAEKQARFLERNRNAASRCRARRKAQNDRLEVRAGELERDRDGLRLLHQSLMSEKAELLARLLNLDCEDTCPGNERSMGGTTCKPPRNLLVSALEEMVCPPDEGLDGSVVDGEDDIAAP